MAPSKAISLVVEQIRTRGLDYPTQGLTADRFAGGWSVYAPVDIDDSDPMAFLDIPVGRSVFLISDAGRLKEISSAIPPRQAEAMFTAEETYVRRAPAEEQSAADLWDQSTRLESEPEGSAGISSFTVDAPSEEAIAARASRLVGPIAQQLATLGPLGGSASPPSSLSRSPAKSPDCGSGPGSGALRLGCPSRRPSWSADSDTLPRACRPGRGGGC